MFKTPNFWLKKNLISLILYPFSWLYYIIFLFKRNISKSLSPKLPIICIGNIIAGGAGKTPTALAIGKLLKKHHINFCYLTRGYGGENKSTILIDKNLKNEQAFMSDEALLLSEIAPTFVNKNRNLAYFDIIKNNYKLVVMDDGLQNYQLKYAYKILVFDSNIATGNNFLLPAGPLRQRLGSIACEINLFVIIGSKNSDLENKIYDFKKDAKIIYAKISSLNINKFINQKLIAFCGIAYPEKFFSLLKNNNLEIFNTFSFADHYKYLKNDIEKLLKLAQENNCKLITTKKDWVKFTKEYQDKIDYLDIELEFENNNFIEEIIKISS